MLGALLVFAAPASATTFCVPAFFAGCPDNGTNLADPDLSHAMSTNGSDGTADKVMIDSSGRISIVPVGGDPAQPQEVDHLRLVTATGSKIIKGLDGLFRIRGGGILPDDPDARLLTGHIEGSNVSATATLVQMIEASRSWDTQLKLISSARDMDSAAADLMRLPE